MCRFIGLPVSLGSVRATRGRLLLLQTWLRCSHRSPYVGAALARSRRNRHVASLSLCPHSIPVAHREGRGRLRAWLPDALFSGRGYRPRQTVEEVSLLLRPATGPCVMLVWLVAKRRPLVASGCCFRLLHEHYTT